MRSFTSLIARGGPFLIIGGLITSAFLFELKPVVTAVPEPPLTSSDLFWGAAQPAPEVIWMVGANGKIVRSDDAGATWRKQSSGTHAGLQAIAAWSPRRAVAAGGGGRVVVTADGGATWAPLAVPARSGLQFLAAAIDPAGRLWLLGERGTALVSDNGGAEFADRSDPRDVAWNAVAFSNRDQGWMVGEFGEIRRTSDGGATWQAVGSLPRSLMSTAACGDGGGVAVGLDGLIAISGDHGATWTVLPPPTSEHLLAVACGDGWWAAVGDRGIALTGPLSPDPARPPRPLDAAEASAAWHTAILGDPQRWLVAGAGAGTIAHGRFKPFSG